MGVSCEAARPAPLRCPTRSEVMDSVLALLPKGRAWQSSEGGPVAGIARGFNPAAFSNEAFSTRVRTQSTLWSFWSAIAEIVTGVNARLCDLRFEFWCATQSETRDLWMAEYGLPDACDPFPDLCAKVDATGGTRCDYYAAIAARAGWDISCREIFDDCGARPGRAKAGRSHPGRRRAGSIVIVVHLDTSIGFTGSRYARPLAGRMRAGRRLACGPDLNPLECIMSRVVHADVKTAYEVN